jgi:DNA (cytosine-5)-methyltransferase 1
MSRPWSSDRRPRTGRSDAEASGRQVRHGSAGLCRSGQVTSGVANFTMIDLFAGIGGIRTAFEAQGGKCVFSSEWDKWARITYQANFPKDEHELVGDIRENLSEVPPHDVLLAGFPCQPFSLAGVSKKNSLDRPHGFEDPTQGTLFHQIKEILEVHRPKAFLLENVKHLKSHDGGNTFKVIMDSLKKELGYDVSCRIVDGRHWVPQHRERTIIVGFREQTDFDWEKLNMPSGSVGTLRERVLHKIDGSEEPIPHDLDEKGQHRFFDYDNNRVLPKYTISDHLYNYLKEYREKHRLAGNGFGFSEVDPDECTKTRTLSARYHKDGSEILVSQPPGNPRRLTPRECARLMGFPNDFKIPSLVKGVSRGVSDTQAYRQFGNSVVVPAIKAVAELMEPHLRGLGAVEKVA